MERRHHGHRNCDCHRDTVDVKMSVNYAAGLSPYPYKGKCGLPERMDTTSATQEKVEQLAALVKSSKHMVAIVGAGISTACGIPDFRGPKGVWTLEEKGCVPESAVTFDTATPSVTHMALVALERAGYLKYLVSQNIDGLTLRSGFPRNRLGELHGNVFMEQCDYCHTQYLGAEAVNTMGLNFTGKFCTQTKRRGHCRGKLRDTLLDWEDELPEKEMFLSEFNCRKADLCLCLGTSLQIVPCGNFPRETKNRGGKVAIVNLQTTKQDRICDLRLWAYCDDIMTRLCVQLGIEIPGWDDARIVKYSLHTGEKEKRDINIIFDNELTVMETGSEWDTYEEKKLVKPEVSVLQESRAHLITSVEVPGIKRDSGMGDIAAAAAIAAAAVRRIPTPRDPAPAPPSDEEDEDNDGTRTIMTAPMGSLTNMGGTLAAQSLPTMNMQQVDAAQIMQHMQPGQMLTVTQLPAQPGQQPQQTFRINTMPAPPPPVEEPQQQQQQQQLVQHVILSGDGGQTTGQVLYAQGRNSEGYIVYGPTPPDNQAQLYVDHNIPESDQTVITQEPLGNMQAEPEQEQQVMNVPQVQQVIVEQIAPQETLVEDNPNVTRLITAPQTITQDQIQNNVITFDNGQVLSGTNGQVLTAANANQVLNASGGVLAAENMQEIDLTVKQEGQVTQITAQSAGQAVHQAAVPQVTMPLAVVQLQQATGTVTTSQEMDLTTKVSSPTSVSILSADNSIPAKKRKYVEIAEMQ